MSKKFWVENGQISTDFNQFEPLPAKIDEVCLLYGGQKLLCAE